MYHRSNRDQRPPTLYHNIMKKAHCGNLKSNKSDGSGVSSEHLKFAVPVIAITVKPGCPALRTGAVG